MQIQESCLKHFAAFKNDILRDAQATMDHEDYCPSSKRNFIAA